MLAVEAAREDEATGFSLVVVGKFTDLVEALALAERTVVALGLEEGLGPVREERVVHGAKLVGCDPRRGRRSGRADGAGHVDERAR